MEKAKKKNLKTKFVTTVELYSPLRQMYWQNEIRYNNIEDFSQQLEKTLNINGEESLKSNDIPKQLIEEIGQTIGLDLNMQEKLADDISHIAVAYSEDQEVLKNSNEFDYNQFLSLILGKYVYTKTDNVVFYDIAVVDKKKNLLTKKEFSRIVNDFIYYLELIIETFNESNESNEDEPKLDNEDPNALTYKLGISSVKINAHSPYEEDLKDREEIDEFYLNEVYQKFLPNNVFKIKDEKSMQLQLCYKGNSLIVFNADGSIEYYASPFTSDQLESKKFRKYIFEN